MDERERNPLQHLPPETLSIRRARLHVQRLANVDASHPAALCVSELATNAVIHSGTEFSVDVSVVGPTVHVEVTDRAQGTPVSPANASLTADGRGLQIVAALSSAWGVDVRPEGKCVWFDVLFAL